MRPFLVEVVASASSPTGRDRQNKSGSRATSETPVKPSPTRYISRRPVRLDGFLRNDEGGEQGLEDLAAAEDQRAQLEQAPS